MKTYLSIGICDKDLGGDFRVELTVADLSLEDFNKVRATIPVAIAELEGIWRRGQDGLPRHLSIKDAPKD